MESINVADVLQEAGDADAKAYSISQVEVEYFVILSTSTFIRLSHLYQEFYVHFIIIINERGDRREVVHLDQGVGGGQVVSMI